MKRTWILPFGLYILAAAERPIEIGDRLELFVDDALIERLQGAELRLHSPQSAGPALVFDRPWEGLSSSMVTVFKDGGRFRMYYRGSTNKDYLIASLVKPGEQTVPDHPLFTCYAESQDGIHWTRPKLGLYEFQGSRDNNIIWTGAFSDSFAPFLDNRPGVTEGERYKAVAAKSTGKRKGALFALTSADGIHWRQLRDEPILTDGAFDTLNLAMWDPLRQLYFAFYRDFKNGVRSFKISTSTDFLRWAPGGWAGFGNTSAEPI